MVTLFKVVVTKQLFHADFIDWYSKPCKETIDLGVFVCEKNACAAVIDYACANKLFKPSKVMKYEIIDTQFPKLTGRRTNAKIYDKTFASDTYKLGDFNRSSSQDRFINEDSLRKLYELVAVDAFPIREHDRWDRSKNWDFQIIPLAYLDTKLPLLDGLEMLEEPYDYI